MRIKTIAIAAIGLRAAACQAWGPTWSEVSGDRYTRVDPNRRPAILLRVGGESVAFTQPFKVTPGTYRVEVQAPPHERFSGSAKAFTLQIEPCRRYYINAEFDNRIGPEWTPVIDHVESIAGCGKASG
ncbi:MAG TPA: hypothetical protein VI258_12720 [Rhodanobacteraceae bacterium]